MQVRLKRDLFVDGILYRALPGPTLIPASLRERLPADAQIVYEKVEKSKREANTLRDFDETRAAEEAFEKKHGK